MRHKAISPFNDDRISGSLMSFYLIKVFDTVAESVWSFRFMKIKTHKILLSLPAGLIIGGLASIAWAKDQEFVDEGGILHESALLPLGFIMLIAGVAVVSMALFIRMVCHWIRCRR
jgi:hypothetical protein